MQGPSRQGRITSSITIIVVCWGACIYAWPPLGKHVRSECYPSVGYCVEAYDLHWIDLLLQEISHPIAVAWSYEGLYPKMGRVVTTELSSGRRKVSKIGYCEVTEGFGFIWYGTEVHVSECTIHLNSAYLTSLYP